jgi:hypothetical protein
MISILSEQRPQVLFICGNHNHTTTMHAVARELTDCDCHFTPYYCDDGTVLDWMRRLGLLEFIPLGREYWTKCLAYLDTQGLAVDLRGARDRYDLVVSCSDLIVPSNVAPTPLVCVQEGMIDPQMFWWKVMQALPRAGLPRWAAGTAATGLSNSYARYCVASEGYRRNFIERGCDPAKIVATGLPNFDAFANHVKPGHWLEGCVLACTSDGRETFRRDDRKAFIERARDIAGIRPLLFKFHPNERMGRAIAEVRKWAPSAGYLTSGCGEELAANCHTLITEWSTLTYVGLALGKPTYSNRDLDHHRAMIPEQHRRGAANIADVCREVLGTNEPRSAFEAA